MKFYHKILQELHLIKEDASVDDINDAISNMHPAIVSYTNDNGNDQAKGKRKIYPVAYGISTAGNPVIRAFEEEGDTTTKVPAWKLFLLSNFNFWKTIKDETFKDKELQGLAKNGLDKQIETLYNISPLSKAAQSWIKNEPEIDAMPITKNDISGSVSGEDIVNNTINTSKRAKSIDNNKNSYYNNMNSIGKLMNASPETKPITQGEVPTAPEETNNNNVLKPVSDNPITKDDIMGNDNKEETPEIVKTYNDLRNRWEKEKDNNENGNI